MRTWGMASKIGVRQARVPTEVLARLTPVSPLFNRPIMNEPQGLCHLLLFPSHQTVARREVPGRPGRQFPADKRLDEDVA